MMTISQLKGLIEFHRRAERAYRACGKTEHADAAKKAAELMEAKIKELESREKA